MKEKIDEDFLRQTYKNIGRGKMEYQKYVFRLLLVGGTIVDRGKAVDEFENKMMKMEIRKGNVDLRIEWLSTVGDRTDLHKPTTGFSISEISPDEKINVIFTQSGKEFKEEWDE